ncbi:threonylcarbamoyl-AMP synthase [Sediminicola luteus]|uniref:L-threonylcarbamoyladenylate synthase n=1 Tax=Sediminicola luteus TaxID=319238 RepID=A0A2A4G750_9FLAO|nr:L-threonylcarbamoyladenylate synthase [Sediminicola luteus]PCE64261.1 threonylcarbamoyl-AMP synthase [Sediminicola luteus]
MPKARKAEGSNRSKNKETLAALLPEIRKTAEIIKEGGIVLYPTDTVWGIGCDATNPEAVAKIYALKQRVQTKAMICLVDSEALLEKHIHQVPDAAWDLIELSERPTTIIYDQPKDLATNLIGEDNTIGIRVARSPFCQYLINRIGKPLVSTSANISGQPTPKTFNDIDPAILKGVDYVVNLPDDSKNARPSVIIKLTNAGVVTIIRQ